MSYLKDNIFKCFFKDFNFFKKQFFFTIDNDAKPKGWRRKPNKRPKSIEEKSN